MTYKWIGAILIVLGSGCVGALMALNAKRELAALKELISALEYMANELSCRMTVLPDLCRKVSEKRTGCVSDFYAILASELEGQVAPNVESCVDVAVCKTLKLPEKVRGLLLQMGQTLGEFDLDGQIASIWALKKECEDLRERMEKDKTQRLRNYETLGLCAGAALAILLL